MHSVPNLYRRVLTSGTPRPAHNNPLCFPVQALGVRHVLVLANTFAGPDLGPHPHLLVPRVVRLLRGE